jgi:hypothetical protein
MEKGKWQVANFGTALPIVKLRYNLIYIKVAGLQR